MLTGINIDSFVYSSLSSGFNKGRTKDIVDLVDFQKWMIFLRSVLQSSIFHRQEGERDCRICGKN